MFVLIPAALIGVLSASSEEGLLEPLNIKGKKNNSKIQCLNLDLQDFRDCMIIYFLEKTVGTRIFMILVMLFYKDRIQLPSGIF